MLSQCSACTCAHSSVLCRATIMCKHASAHRQSNALVVVHGTKRCSARCLHAAVCMPRLRVRSVARCWHVWPFHAQYASRLQVFTVHAALASLPGCAQVCE
jgi:hypothetical protein